jgi:hypothetical protein
MPRNYRTTFLGLGALVLAGALTAPAIPAFASSSPVTRARIVAHFDIGALQQPENITLEPDGDADVTFAYAHQVARVTPQGRVTILAGGAVRMCASAAARRAAASPSRPWARSPIACTRASSG